VLITFQVASVRLRVAVTPGLLVNELAADEHFRVADGADKNYTGGNC